MGRQGNIVFRAMMCVPFVLFVVGSASASGGWRDEFGFGMAATAWRTSDTSSGDATVGRLGLLRENVAGDGRHQRFRLRSRLDLGRAGYDQGNEELHDDYASGLLAGGWGYGTGKLGVIGELGVMSWRVFGNQEERQRLSYVGFGYYDYQSRWHKLGHLPLPLDRSGLQLRYYRDEYSDHRLWGVNWDWGKRVGRGLVRLELEFAVDTDKARQDNGIEDYLAVGLSVDRAF